jgi:glycopeptide antibiotics resistance protein
MVEATQFFLPRHPSVIDVFTNTAGTVLGFELMRRSKLSEKIAGRAVQLWRRLSFRLVCAGIGVCAALTLGMSPYLLNAPVNWDEDYHLLIGNEATLDRPWQGQVFRVAVFDRALGDAEIQARYQCGMEDGPMSTSADSIVALYDLARTEGDTLHDRTGNGPPLAGARYQWDDNGKGLIVHSGGYLRSILPMIKIVRAVKQTRQFSVEAWVRTLDLSQRGPARIVTISDSPSTRNFTLGQDGEDLNFRVRTPLTGLNGVRTHLRAKAVFQDEDVHHLVATFNRGLARLAVDGKISRDVIRADIDYLPDILHFGQNTAAQVAFCYVVFFPVSVLLFFVFSYHRFWLTMITAFLLAAVIEGFYVVTIGQPFGWYLLSLVLLMAFLGGVFGRLLQSHCNIVE